MNKLIDLRFVIGLFFLIIGVMLVVYHLRTLRETNVNLWSGIVFCAFGTLMVILSFQKDANDELIEGRRKERTKRTS